MLLKPDVREELRHPGIPSDHRVTQSQHISLKGLAARTLKPTVDAGTFFANKPDGRNCSPGGNSLLMVGH
jgi:hypothetical protein